MINVCCCLFSATVHSEHMGVLQSSISSSSSSSGPLGPRPVVSFTGASAILARKSGEEWVPSPPGWLGHELWPLPKGSVYSSTVWFNRYWPEPWHPATAANSPRARKVMIRFLEKSGAATLGLVSEFLALSVRSPSWREWVGGREEGDSPGLWKQKRPVRQAR